MNTVTKKGVYYKKRFKWGEGCLTSLDGELVRHFFWWN